MKYFCRPHFSNSQTLQAFRFGLSFSCKGAVKNYQGGGLQILKYCKIKKLLPSLYISIKNCDPPNAMDQKSVTPQVLLVSVIFVPIALDSWRFGGTVDL